MQYFHKLREKGALALALLFTIVLVAAVACGSAAQETSAPAKPADTAMQATAVPQATTAPAMDKMMMEVNPGTVTFMTGSFGTERFDSTYGSTSPDANRHFHGYLVGSDVEDGFLIVVPGIATKWEISET